MLYNADPTKTKSWRHLSEHFEKIKDVHMKDLFATDPQRFNRFQFGLRISCWITLKTELQKKHCSF